MTNVIDLKASQIEALNKAVIEYQLYSKGDDSNFLIKLLIGLKRFYDEGAIASHIELPTSYHDAFLELRDSSITFDEIILDRLCSIIDKLDLIPLSLSLKLTEMYHSRAYDLVKMGTLLKAVLSTDLSDKSLKSSNTTIKGVLAFVDRKLSRYSESTGINSNDGVAFNIALLMCKLAGLNKGDDVYLPFDKSASIIPGLIDEALSKGLCLSNDINLTIQLQNFNLIEHIQLDLLIVGALGHNFYNEHPLLKPILTPRKRLKLDVLNKDNWDALYEDSKKDTLLSFNKVISIPPFGLSTDKDLINKDRFNRFQSNMQSLKTSDFAQLYAAFAHTKANGKAVIMTYNGPLIRHSEIEYRKKLVDSDLIEAIINLPFGVIGASINPVLLVLRRQKTKSKSRYIHFIDAQNLLDNHMNGIDETVFLYNEPSDVDHISRLVNINQIRDNKYSLRPGDYVDDSHEAHNLRGLLNEHKNYHLRSLGDNDVSISIKKIKKEEDVIDDGNFLYVPSISNMNPLVDIKERLKTTKTKIDRYYQIELDEDVVLAEFAEYFFKTDLGKALFEATGEGATVPHVNLERLKGCKIATPPIEVQRNILETFNKLQSLNQLIENYKRNVALNPSNAAQLSNKLDEMISSVSKLSDEDIVLGLIRGGENKHVEFKETFEVNLHTNSKDPKIVDSSIKTIAAFLNSGGGDLLIGIADDKAVKGIETDLKLQKKGLDGFLLHFKNFIERRIGAQYYPLIDQKIVYVNGKPIFKVRCESAKDAKMSPVMVDDEDCFIRTNPATDKLTGQKLVEFIKSFDSD